MYLDSEGHKKSKNYTAMTPMPMIIPTNVRTIPMLKDLNKFFYPDASFHIIPIFKPLLFLLSNRVIKKSAFYSEFANNNYEAKRAFSYSSILHKAASSSGIKRLCFLPRSTKSPITCFPSVLRPLSMSASSDGP